MSAMGFRERFTQVGEHYKPSEIQDMKNKLITNLIQGAVLDMMSKVTFDEKKHRYTRISDGKYLAGVSSISGLIPKDFLVAWGAKEAVKQFGFFDKVDGESHEEEMKTLEAKLEELKQYDPVTFLEVLKNAKGAHARKSKDAKDIGTEGHAWCEKYVLSKIRGTKTPAIPKGELERPLKLFVEWAEANIDEWLASEARVACPEVHEFAGTLDAIAITKDGALSIIDFKFANQISEEYYLQTAGYCIPFEPYFEPYKIQFNKRIILRMPKTETLLEYQPKTRTYKKVPNDFEVREVPTPYDFDKKTFLALRDTERWINYNK